MVITARIALLQVLVMANLTCSTMSTLSLVDLATLDRIASGGACVPHDCAIRGPTVDLLTQF